MTAVSAVRRQFISTYADAPQVASVCLRHPGRNGESWYIEVSLHSDLDLPEFFQGLEVRKIAKQAARPKASEPALDLTGTRQAFARQYMTDDRVIGVRMKRRVGDMDRWFIDVTVAADHADELDLPDEFRGFEVRLRTGQKGVLAYLPR